MIGDLIEIERAKRDVYADVPLVTDAPSIISEMPEGEGQSNDVTLKAVPAAAATLFAGWLDALKDKLSVRARQHDEVS
jgi:hypothetical protein